MSSHRVLARWTGYCASCPVEQPLLLVSHGPHGFRGWLSGGGPEDRTLSYACGVCGRTEHVPATELEDELYDASMLRWPDWADESTAPSLEQLPGFSPVVVSLPSPAPIPVLEQVVEPAYEPAFEPDYEPAFELVPELLPEPVQAAVEPAPAVVRVRIVTLPLQRVSATDLVAAAA